MSERGEREAGPPLPANASPALSAAVAAALAWLRELDEEAAATRPR